jgi:SHS2 domain-containing protein
MLSDSYFRTSYRKGILGQLTISPRVTPGNKNLFKKMPGAKMKHYNFIKHTADVGIKVYGKDKKSLFLNAAYAFFALITDLETIEPKNEVTVEVKGESLEEVFFNWLDELLFLFDTKGFVGCEIIIEKWDKIELFARIKGETFNPHKHPLNACIKAVTYHNFKVSQVNDHWEAKVIFDI